MNTNLAYREAVWEEMLNGRLVLLSPRPATNLYDDLTISLQDIFKRTI